MRHLFILTLAFLILSACGKKGPLVPPEALISAPVSDLKAMQRGEGIQISWSIPNSDVGGRPVRDLAGFRLMRREVLPPADDCETCSDAYKIVRQIDLEFPRDARVVGNRVYSSDSEASIGRSYQYKVVSYLKDGTSSHDSNRVRITVETPFPAPVLNVESTPTSILIKWTGAGLPHGPRITGYNIYRRRSGTPPGLVPINTSPLTTDNFEDFRLERGVVYLYTIRSVAEDNGMVVESSPSNEVSASLAEPD